MFLGVTWPLLTFEGISYAIWILCLAHAWGQGARRRERVAILLTGTAYGVTLETLTIYQLHAYHYGQFLVMFFGQVPLCIGVGWGIILYSSIAFADALRLAPAAWAVVVGLLGLNIDVTMDTVAIRLGMWNWHQWNFARSTYVLIPGTSQYALAAPTVQWFGVPYGNFYAWFIVLTSCAALFRWLKPGESRTIIALVGKCVLTLLGSVIVLTLLDQIYTDYFNGSSWPVIVEVVGSLVLIAALARSQAVSGFAAARVRDPAAVHGLPAVIAVPLFFHLFFLAMLATIAIDPSLIPRADMVAALPAQLPYLATIAGAMTIIGIGLHIWQARRRATSIAEPAASSVGASVSTHPTVVAD